VSRLVPQRLGLPSSGRVLSLSGDALPRAGPAGFPSSASLASRAPFGSSCDSLSAVEVGAGGSALGLRFEAGRSCPGLVRQAGLDRGTLPRDRPARGFRRACEAVSRAAPSGQVRAQRKLSRDALGWCWSSPSRGRPLPAEKTAQEAPRASGGLHPGRNPGRPLRGRWRHEQALQDPAVWLLLI
jgi:hypothetical protein